MAIGTVTNLVDTLQQAGLLTPERQAELSRSLKGRYAEPRDLARELVNRGWLTPYQVNQLLQGKGSDLVLGSYVILERLGEGGMGQVFKARHQAMNRLVALKVIRKDLLANPKAVLRFQREIKLAGQLTHPNVVMALDAAQIGDTHIFVMEYVEGIDLSRLVKQNGPLAVVEACEYICQAAQGLQHAHERGMVHRDIKPSNLLLGGGKGQRPLIKLLDLGLARMKESETETSALTHEGSVVGTPDYMAPEQSKDSRATDIRGDLYSLGCTLYFLLTGQPPFAGNTLAEIILKHHMDPPPDIRSRRSGVPPAVADIIRTLMAKRPEDRYQTPAELAASLGAVLAGQPLPARTLGPRTRTGPLKRLIGMVKGDSTLSASGTLGYRTEPELATRSWRLRRLLLAVVGGFLALGLVVFLAVFFFRSGPPLEQLRNGSIPKAERLPGLPEEVVAVLGEHRGRHASMVQSVAYSPDGALAASAGEDGAVRIWDTATMRQQLVYKLANVSRAPAVAFAPTGNQVVFGEAPQKPTEQGSIWLWDVGAKERPRVLARQEEGEVSALAFSPNGRRLASAGPGVVNLWSRSDTDLKKLYSLDHTSNQKKIMVLSLAFAPSGKFLASCAADNLIQDNQVRLWHLDDKSARAQPLAVPAGRKPTCVAISQNGQIVAAGCLDGSVLLWDLPEGKPRSGTLKLVGQVRSLTFTDGMLLCGTGQYRLDQTTNSLVPIKGTVALANPNQSGNLPIASPGEPSPVLSVAVSLKGNQFIAGSSDGSVRFWELAGDKIKERGEPQLQGHTAVVTSVAFAPDGKTLATGSLDRYVRLWQFSGTTANEWTNLPGQRLGVTCVAFSPDGKRLACTGDWDPLVRVWDLGAGHLPRQWNDPPAPRPNQTEVSGFSLGISPDSKFLAVGGGLPTQTGGVWQVNGNIHVWDLSPGDWSKLQSIPVQSRAYMTSLVFSPDGNTLASTGLDKAVCTWDMAGKPLRQTPTKNYRASDYAVAASFSPDGKTIVFGAGVTVRFWNATTDNAPRELAEPAKHTGRVTATAFSPDGKILASVGHDGLLLLWDPQTAQVHHSWQFPGPIYSVAFAPDGRHLALGSDLGTAYIFRLSKEHLSKK